MQLLELEGALDLAALKGGEAVRQPRLTNVRLERKVVLEEISMVEDTPDDQVFELHNAALWGTHPYGYSILGTRESVVALDTEDLRVLHALAYRPSQIVIAASGNIEHEQLLEVLSANICNLDLSIAFSPSPPGLEHRRKILK